MLIDGADDLKVLRADIVTFSNDLNQTDDGGEVFEWLL